MLRSFLDTDGSLGRLIKRFGIIFPSIFLFAGLLVLPPESGGGKHWWPYYKVPTIEITGVRADKGVQITTHNYPANQTFKVVMGLYGSKGLYGYEVGTYESEDGSSREERFLIPEKLFGAHRIAIRLQTEHRFPYYSYNWFFNNDTLDQPVSFDDLTIEDG